MPRSRLTPDPVRVLDLELSVPLQAIDALEGYTSALALVRARGVPLGMIDVPLEDGRCSAQLLDRLLVDQLGFGVMAALSDPAPARGFSDTLAPALQERSAAEGSRSDRPTPPMTVAVCTRNRAPELRTCLESLGSLTYPRLEVLVVDNAPRDDSTARLLATNCPGMRYVCEPRPGLDWARNRAIAEASGEIIAFTDDDVVVDPDWASALAAAFADAPPDVMAVAGLVIPLELETEAQIFFERYGSFIAGFTREDFRAGRGWGVRGAWHLALMAQRFTGANLAFRRAGFDVFGRFDPALDVGTPTNGGGDIEILFRLLQEGYAIRYEPRAIVRHRHRRSYAELQHQISGWGSGYGAFLTSGMLRYPGSAWVLALLGSNALAQQLRRLTRALLHDPGFPRRLIVTEMAGLLLGPLRYLQARRRASRVAHVTRQVPAELPSR